MQQTIVALFRSMQQVETVVKTIRDKGLANDEISFVVKSVPQKQKFSEEYAREIARDVTKNTLHDPGLPLMDPPSVDVSGLGTVTVGGPLGRLLSEENHTLTDALSFYGVARERGTQLEDMIQKGHILMIVETNTTKASNVSNILADLGGREIEKWRKSVDKPLHPWNKGN